MHPVCVAGLEQVLSLALGVIGTNHSCNSSEGSKKPSVVLQTPSRSQLCFKSMAPELRSFLKTFTIACLSSEPVILYHLESPPPPKFVLYTIESPTKYFIWRKADLTDHGTIWIEVYTRINLEDGPVHLQKKNSIKRYQILYPSY